MSITAMKQALEALERSVHELRGITATQDMTEAITSLRQAIEEAEKQVCVGCEGNPQGENIPCAVCGATPQPQREWVGLTEDEVKHMLELFVIPPHHVEMVARAIEAKLKEKNT